MIYAHNAISRFYSVYRANKTHLWRSEPALEKIDNIKYEIGRHQMVGYALIEICVPNSAGIKVLLDLQTFEAKLLNSSMQEYFKEVKVIESRYL